MNAQAAQVNITELNKSKDFEMPFNNKIISLRGEDLIT